MSSVTSVGRRSAKRERRPRKGGMRGEEEEDGGLRVERSRAVTGQRVPRVARGKRATAVAVAAAAKPKVRSLRTHTIKVRN
jgi:hypothetical protein